MELVYDFILDGNFGTAPFKIPQMSFAKSALAVAENGGHDTYMIEEVIDEVADGKFIKYIGNGSAVPSDFEDVSLADRAAFLSFCQHIQYIKTQEMAFIGDFQGNVMCIHCMASSTNYIITAAKVDGLCSQTLKLSRLRKYFAQGTMIFHDCLLIRIWDSETGPIFADGNLASTHIAFTTDHRCTYFCVYFGLEPFTDSLEFSTQNLSLHRQKLFIGMSKSLPPKASSMRRSQDEMVISKQKEIRATPSQGQCDNELIDV